MREYLCRKWNCFDQKKMKTRRSCYPYIQAEESCEEEGGHKAVENGLMRKDDVLPNDQESLSLISLFFFFFHPQELETTIGPSNL